MARTHGPLFSLSAEGQLSTAIVFQRSATGHYVRPYKLPRYNPSASQRATQILSRYLSKRWSRLSLADRDTWTDVAEADRTSHWGAFQRRNHMRWLNGYFPSDTWPATETGSALSVLPRDQLIQIAPTTPMHTGAANQWSNNLLYQFIKHYNYQRIRQSCSIRQLSIVIASKPAAVTHFYLEIWRFDGTYFDLVSRTDIWSLLSIGNPCTITLPSPIAVQEGDYYGYHYTSSTGPPQFLYAAAAPNNNPCRYTSSVAMPDLNADWDAKTQLGLDPDILLYATAPWLMAAGDSITAGGTYHNSLWTYPIAGTRDPNAALAYPPQLAALLGTESQNCGYTSRTSAQVLSAWATEVTPQHPQLALLIVGVNDIATSVSKSTYLANVNAIIDAAAADASAVALISILPWTNGSTAQLNTRDEWNAELALIPASRSDCLYLNVADQLGQFRAGGPAGNKWDIATAYDLDGVHLTTAGYTALAQAIYQELCRTQHGASVPTNADAPTNWLLGLRPYNDDIAGFSIHRQASAITSLNRLNCIDIIDPNNSTRGLWAFTERPPPATYHYRAAAFSTTGKLLYTTPDKQVTVT